MESDKDDLGLEVKMLNGNIERMCSTNNFQELETNLALAKIRIEEIFNCNLRRMVNKNNRN